MTFHVYIGFDAIDDEAYDVAVKSLHRHATMAVRHHPIRDWEMRLRCEFRRTYEVQPSGQKVDQYGEPHSTEFTWTRWLAPYYHRRVLGLPDDWILFVDADVMFRADVKDLYLQARNVYDVMVVKHDYTPQEKTKIVGLEQQRYPRKNWASVMLLNTARLPQLNPAFINNARREDVFGFGWIDDHLIGSLHPKWNHLVGVDLPPEPDDTAIAHFTLGTPEKPGYEHQVYAHEWLRYREHIDAERLGIRTNAAANAP